MRLYITLIGISLFISTSIFSQWKNVAPNLLGIHNRDPYGGCLTHYNGVLWAGYDEIYISLDSGKIWQSRTPIKNSERAVNISVFDEQTAIVATIPGNIYITKDQGISWKKLNTNFTLLYGATFLASPNQIACYTGDCDLYVTLDGGLTWVKKFSDTFISHVISGNGGMIYVIAGSNKGSKMYTSSDYGNNWISTNGTFDWDSWSIVRDQCDTSTFYIANEEFIAPTDYLSSVFVSSNDGALWTKQNSHNEVYHCGSVTASENSVFVQTYRGIDRSTDKGSTWKTVGDIPNTYDTKCVTALNANIIFAIDSFGSVWATFNSGGDSVSFSSGGGTGTFNFSSSKIINDSTAVTVHLPIYFHHTGKMSNIDMVMHYPAGPLQYLGATLVNGKSIEVSGSVWPGRAQFHFEAGDLNVLADSVVGYVNFKWSPLEFDCATINFDSITSQTIVDCSSQLLAPSPFKGIIGAYKWCGESAVMNSPQSDLHFSIVPNPSRGIFTISSNEYSGNATITLTDELGKTVLTEKQIITASGVMIDASKCTAGNYFLRVETPQGKMTYSIKLLE